RSEMTDGAKLRVPSVANIFLQHSPLHVRYWHKADILTASINVRFRGAKRTLTTPGATGTIYSLGFRERRPGSFAKGPLKISFLKKLENPAVRAVAKY
ncbi:MAG: hypothetical protein WB540_12280, partial [Pseudolabrys sp.]